MIYELDLSDDAEADIDSILEWSVVQFGPQVREGYKALISFALAAIARDPQLLGSHDRRDLDADIRIVHLRSLRTRPRSKAKRIARPRHIVVYRINDDAIEVVRLLHEAANVDALGAGE